MIEATLVLTQHVLHLDVHHPLHEVLHNGGSLDVTALDWRGNQISSLHDAHQHTYVAAYDVIYHITGKIGCALPREWFASSATSMFAVVATLARPYLEPLIEVFLAPIQELPQIATSFLICLRQGIDVRTTLRVKLQCFLDVIHKFPSYFPDFIPSRKCQ